MKLDNISELDLRLELMSLEHKLEDKEKEAEFKKVLEAVKEEYSLDTKNKKEFNKKVAEYNGIAPKELLDSPNYKILCEEYSSSATNAIIEELGKLGFTRREVLALLYFKDRE